MSIFSSEGAVEGWLHYSPQDQTNFSSEGLTDLHLFCRDAQVQCSSRILSGEFRFLKCALHGPCRCLFKLSIHSVVCICANRGA